VSRSATSSMRSQSSNRSCSTIRSTASTSSARPPNPTFPSHTAHRVDGQLRELRCHYGRSLYRVLHRRSGNLVILLHALSKTTAKIPASEIKIGNERWADFKQRMEALPRKRPRAIGGDPETLRKLATALDMRLVIGFERGPKNAPKRDLVVFG
jgi:hypothetical protein